MSSETLAQRIRDILGPYNDDTESLQNLISNLVLKLDDALSQQEAEPVGETFEDAINGQLVFVRLKQDLPIGTKLYLHQPKPASHPIEPSPLCRSESSESEGQSGLSSIDDSQTSQGLESHQEAWLKFNSLLNDDDPAKIRPVASVPQKEHDLQDVRCGCCGYMTYHREHMGCIRAARPSVPQDVERAIEALDDLFWLAHGSITSGDYSRFRNAIAVVARAARPTRQRDVEEWIRAKAMDARGDLIYASDLRTFLAQRDDGSVRVPVEPTAAMIDAGVAMALQVSVHGQGGWSNYVRDLYKQMLTASKEGV